MKPDAKIYAMIDDLSRGSCLELLGCDDELSHHNAIRLVREGYEAGSIDPDDIMLQWQDDQEPLDTDGDTSKWNENGEGQEADNDRYASRAFKE